MARQPNLYDVINAYGANPESFSDEDTMAIAQAAQQAGIPFSPANSAYRVAKNFGANLLDGLMLDGMPDSWKPHQVTGADGVAATAGDLASWLVPMAAMAKGAAKGGSALARMLGSNSKMGLALPALKIDFMADKMANRVVQAINGATKNANSNQSAQELLQVVMKEKLKKTLGDPNARPNLYKAGKALITPLSHVGGYLSRKDNQRLNTMLAYAMSGAVSGAGMAAVGGMADSIGEGDFVGGALGVVPNALMGALGGAAGGGLMGGVIPSKFRGFADATGGGFGDRSQEDIITRFLRPESDGGIIGMKQDVNQKLAMTMAGMNGGQEMMPSWSGMSFNSSAKSFSRPYIYSQGMGSYPSGMNGNSEINPVYEEILRKLAAMGL